MSSRLNRATGLRLLRGAPSAVALTGDDGEISFGDLADRVDARRDDLGTTRRLVMIEGANTVESIATYLAALEGGHPMILVDSLSSDHSRALIERFDPDVVAGDFGEWQLVERREATRHELHPELAMLASTSGSTGSPKLVRLSRDNVESNALAIAEYLRLDENERAITTLPLHYCYGLSVVNSHLVAGASVALTSHSVVADDFWALFNSTRATSFAGVPYTFDLLDAAAFDERSLPSLRRITQAGGKLHPDRIRHFARLGRERGFEFVVMYGQTEATARMAFVPPALAESAAGAIGVAIPGGLLRIDAAAGETGELVYEGPNVMMGYAEEPAALARDGELTELRTGDLARQRDDGLFEIVGRSNRFAKIFGLRIDLDRVESHLAERGLDARAASTDEHLLLFVTNDRSAAETRDLAASLTNLPPHSIRALALDEIPRTSSGKVDYAALVQFAELAEVLDEQSREATPEAVRNVFAVVLGRPDATVDDSFAALSGDSLSYIEASIRLEQLLGSLPRDWPGQSARELAGGIQPARSERRMTRLETPVILRALAIVLIVGTHANLLTIMGGAHLLLAVAGYNLARFSLADVPGVSRVRAVISSTAQIVVPAVLWIGGIGLVTGTYAVATALLVNNVFGIASWSAQWHFWFLEALVYTLLALAALLAIPQVDKLERRFPFAFALGALALALAARLVISGGIQAGAIGRYQAVVVVWCIVLGWLAARSTTVAKRVVTTVLAAVSVAGFFGDPLREAIVAVGIALLVWVPAIAMVRWLVPVVGAVAGASMFIYLTHWQIYPHLENSVPWLATLLSIAVGVAVWKAHSVTLAFATKRVSALRGRRPLLRRR